jgi:hypothetical protein
MKKTKDIREGSMIRRLSDGTEIGEPCRSYPLTDCELEKHIERVGLVPHKIIVPGEYYFNVWLGRKPLAE